MSYAASNIETRWSSKPTLVTITAQMPLTAAWPLNEHGEVAATVFGKERVLRISEPVLMWVARPASHTMGLPWAEKEWLYHCVTSDGLKYGFMSRSHPIAYGIDYEVSNYLSTTITC